MTVDTSLPPLEAAKRMRDLCQDLRVRLIAASPDVIGYERMLKRRFDVEYARLYERKK